MVTRRLDALRGCFTALVTPMRRGRPSLPDLTRLVEMQIAGGVSGLCPCGTTGEAPTLSETEQAAVIEAVVAAAAGRVPVVAGAGSNDTMKAVVLARAARRAGAHAVLAVAPYYVRPTQEGLYRHFRATVDEGGLPVVLYHIPSRTGVSIEVDTVARLFRAGGVVGLKEAHGSVERVTRLREACEVPLLSGDDALTLPFVSLGAVGVVSVASNVVPEQVSRMVAHALEGRAAEALTIHERIAPLVRALFLESNPIPVKAALKTLGRIGSDEVRLPLVTASAATREALRSALVAAGHARARRRRPREF